MIVSHITYYTNCGREERLLLVNLPGVPAVNHEIKWPNSDPDIVGHYVRSVAWVADTDQLITWHLKITLGCRGV